MQIGAADQALDSDTIARRHLLTGVAFLAAAGFFMTMAATKLVFPAFLDGLGLWSYGRLTQMALALTVFGWLTPSLLGAAYYLIPRLSEAPLRRTQIANWNLLFLTAVVIAGTISVGLGAGDGYELLPFPIWADLLLFLALTAPAGVIALSLRDRSEAPPQAPLLHITAAVVILPFIAVLANLPGLDPIGTSILNAFTTSGLHYLWIIAGVVGLLLYLVPNLGGGYLFSEKLARIGFWTLLLAGGGAGYARFTYGPAPDWLETVAIVLGLILIITAISVFSNVAATAKGRWDAIRGSTPLRFALAAGLMFPIPVLASTVGGFRGVASIVGLTSWWDGVSFFILFGIAGWGTAAFVYAVLPRLLGRSIYSENLARRHLSLSIIGVLTTATMLWISGLVAGFTWSGGNYSGSFANTGEGFLQTRLSLSMLSVLVLIGVLVTFVSQMIHVYLIYRTVTSGTPTVKEVLVESADE